MTTKKKTMPYSFILASNSPRRRVLFARIVPRHLFYVVASRIKEKTLPGERPERFVIRMAEKKARTALEKCGVEASDCKTVIGADTVVVLGKQILQQPKSMADARNMLCLLSGRRHEVMTGVCFLFPGSSKPECILVKSKVWFKNLSERIINNYIGTGETMDKAGAYAIQGKGRRLIRKYRGSYTNIVGMPVKEIKEFLKSRFSQFPVCGVRAP